MASKSYQTIICEHLQSRFDWWWSLYNSLLETAAAYEKDMPFSFDPYADAAMIENLNQDAEYARVISVGLAEELGRAESAIAPKPKPQPKPQPAPAPEPEPIDVSDIPFAAVDAQPQSKPRKPYRIWQPNYKWPPSPRVIRVPVLGEVS